LLYILLIKIISISHCAVIVNITNVDTNGIILNYTASIPLFEIYYPYSSINTTEIYGIPVYIHNINGSIIYSDKYNGIVLSFVQGDENYTLNGSTLPIAPGKILPIIHLYHSHSPPNYAYSVLILTSVLVLSFYTLFRRIKE
jgi:hypothetical protein